MQNVPISKILDVRDSLSWQRNELQVLAAALKAPMESEMPDSFFDGAIRSIRNVEANLKQVEEFLERQDNP